MRTRGEQGSATVLVVACLSFLLLTGAALGVVAAMVRAHRMAQSAADLAALAAASALQRGDAACATAARVASANAASLGDCRAAGREVRLTVTVPGPVWLGRASDLTAEARAGLGRG